MLKDDYKVNDRVIITNVKGRWGHRLKPFTEAVVIGPKYVDFAGEAEWTVSGTTTYGDEIEQLLGVEHMIPRA